MKRLKAAWRYRGQTFAQIRALITVGEDEREDENGGEDDFLTENNYSWDYAAIFKNEAPKAEEAAL